MASDTEHPQTDVKKATENYGRFLGMTKVAIIVVAIVVILIVLLIS